MGLFRRNNGYDRARILDSAMRARAKKKRHQAIALYRWVLSVEPANPELHGKLAPLLAETGQQFDAWASFKTVARAYLRDGHSDKALAIYKEATLYLPREVQAWQAVARLLAKRGQKQEALETLVEGSRRFRTRWLRPQAIHLLRRARDLEPWSFQVVLELSRLLALQQQPREAHTLLGGLVERCGGERLRRVRAVQFQLSPSPVSAWRWLHAWIRTAPEPTPPSPKRRPAGVVPIHKPVVKRA